MLRSYEAIYKGGQLKWRSEQPQISSARVIATILEDITANPTQRVAFPAIAGKARTLGDVGIAIVTEDDWEGLK
ncbi:MULTISPECIES: hypothetical protein [Cyanophyceae]|uniref:hypothetical protein n=1 Tax=Cyanophyceae TaxID=3028117 RepID=UPI0016887C5B|nr:MULTISPECIES: hypothetical protein [Cyanophyceae]MBD1916569.1 hypothetical protein [Phormidium sp. FACHB-77]MBD2032136.1 hypothetical protein [Phormidium sp. FACHB-322]MBD2053016.1 hypothetical protein [Leptolyngbya sp. FACHB-60]